MLPLVLVFTVAGIHVGMKTVDKDVVALHGKGCFVDGVGHLGGRYYLDSSRTVTLRTEIGVDDMTELVELRRGDHLPASCQGPKDAFVSAALSGTAAVDHGIRLGMARAEIERTLGAPSRVEHDGAATLLVYETDVEKDPRVTLAYSATFRFEAEHLTGIALYDGE